MPFKRATREQLRLRMAFAGPSGSGKTRSAMEVAQHLGTNMAVIDTERGSASRYAGDFQFDVCELTDFNPFRYVEAINDAASGGYDVLIIDSLSHAWFWELDHVNGFSDWKKVRPLERKLVDAMLGFPGHLIVTMRTKTEYVVEEGFNRHGKSTAVPKKVGTAPIQASGIEYEFDIAGELDLDHTLTVSKTRCPRLNGKQISYPGEEFATELLTWLRMGTPAIETGMQKGLRVKREREALKMPLETAKALLMQHYGVDSPTELNSEQCDAFIELMKGQAQSSSSVSALVVSEPEPIEIQSCEVV